LKCVWYIKDRYCIWQWLINLTGYIALKLEDFYGLGEDWKKAVMPFLKVLAQNFPAKTEKNHKSWCL
jgi:hypothetical protein